MPWTMMMGRFMYLLYDSMAYKLYSNDAERIERETGKSTKDLSEEELVTAMKRLGIQKLEITPEDQETISTSKQPVKVLSKEDILTAMKRLGINKLEVVSNRQQSTPQSNIKPINQFCIYCSNSLSIDGIYCSRCGKKRSER
jgi:vacuolar-type H+-ATPase subunit F/Vma7